MSVSLERKPISVPEFWAGGIALAAITLIAFGGLRVAQPQNPLPEPARYASVSIQSSEALAKLPVEQPRTSPDVVGATRDVQSLEPRLGTSNAMPIVANGAEAPRLPGADRPVAGPTGGLVRPGIQQPGAEGDSQGLTDAVWAPPLSNFRDTRLASNQRRNGPDQPSASPDATFIGSWADDIGQCRTGRRAPIVISSRAAKTASVECNFGGVTRVAANRWRVTATCLAGGKSWRANVALKLAEPKLTWSSERGTDIFVRCKS
jgi:hypothetical protein